MTKKSSKRRSAKKKPTTRVGREKKERIVKTLRVLDFFTRYSKIITISVIILAIMLGVYIRIIPALNYGIELDANDPWIEYWLSKYLAEHGILSWNTLTRDNPATHIFWWPWGRSFYSTEYPGVPAVAAATWSIGKSLDFTLKEWVALQPVFSSIIAIITLFLLVRELAGNLAGITAALLFALIPGASDRTIVGFVEKEGISIPLIYVFILLLLYSYKLHSRTLRLSFACLSGLTLGLLGFFWGGIHFAIAITAAYMALLPFFHNIDTETLLKHVILVVTALVVLSLSPTLGVLYITREIGLLLPAGLLLLLIYYAISKTRLPRVTYLIVLALITIAGLLAIEMGLIQVSGRVAYAMGLAKNVSPLVESVQEHHPPTLRSLLLNYGVALILSFLSLMYMLYKVLITREKIHPVLMMLSIAFVVAFIANLRMAYFTQLASSVSIMLAPYVLTLVSSQLSRVATVEEKAKKTRRERRYYAQADPLVVISGIVIIALVLGGIAWHGFTAYSVHQHRVPSIKAAGLPLAIENDAWLYTLDYIRGHLPKDSLIVAWWDYGYWISVGTGHPTLADGATINSTQIRILASILTGDEEEASRLLSKLGAKPNDTYVLVYDVFLVLGSEENTTYVTPTLQYPLQADIAKSYWMLRISGKDPIAYYDLSLAQSQGILSPLWTSPLVYNNTLIYKLFVHGIYSLSSYIYGDICLNTSQNYVFAYLNPLNIVPQPNMTRFKPEAIIVDCMPGGGQKAFVAIMLYKWIG